MTQKLSIVVAVAKETYGIGYEGGLPWHIPGEMKYFKQLTSHTTEINGRNAVIMGRKTWQSIPKKFRPLSDRLNIVISSKTENELDIISNDNLILCNSLEQAIEKTNDMNLDNLYLIGGGSLYFYALKNKLVKEMFVTKIEGDYKVDVYFPLFDLEGSEFTQVSNLFADDKFNVPSCEFEKYVLKSSLTQPTVLHDVTHSQNENKQPNTQHLSDLDLSRSVIERNYHKHEEYQYLKLVLDCIVAGNRKMDRTKVGTYSLFGKTMRYNLAENVFPLLTTKNTFFRGVVEELLFFISGKTDNKILQQKRIHIWDLNCTREYLDKIGLEGREVNDLGPVYGFQWRHFGAEYDTFETEYTGKGVDQLKELIETIKSNPNSRRMILSAWNVTDLKKMVLPPCHMFAQFYVHDGKLSCQMYQRSADLGLGVPFNIASYALLTRILAQCCDLEAGEFIHVIGDCHVYANHVDQLKEQLKREPKTFPTLEINSDKKSIDDFVYEDFKLVGYKHHKRLKMKMAV